MNNAAQWQIGFPGRTGSFSERAAQAVQTELARSAWASAPRCAGRTFAEAWEWATLGAARMLVLPIWNSTAGPVRPTWECIATDANHPLWLAGTVECKVNHALLVGAGVSIDAIRRVRSHPQALAQCAAYIARHGWTLEESQNTAFAAEEVANGGQKDLAAIAHRDNADTLGLDVVADQIQDDADNRTTFGVFVSPTRNHVEVALETQQPVIIIGRQTQPKWEAHLTDNGVTAADRVQVGAFEGVRTPSKDAGMAVADALRGDIIGTYEPFSCARVSAFS